LEYSGEKRTHRTLLFAKAGVRHTTEKNAGGDILQNAVVGVPQTKEHVGKCLSMYKTTHKLGRRSEKLRGEEHEKFRRITRRSKKKGPEAQMLLLGQMSTSRATLENFTGIVKK